MRILRFARALRWLIGERLVTRHNIRAAWLGAGGDPFPAATSPDLTDAEWDEWMDAIS